MYGLINQGLHDLAVQTGGEEMWREIKSNADVGLEAFVGMDTYPDDVTYRIHVRLRRGPIHFVDFE